MNARLLSVTLALAALGAGCVAASPVPVGPLEPAATASSTPVPSASASFRLSGKVYDEDMNAVAGATVKLATGGSATTGADGAYVLETAPGEQTVTAEKPGFTSRSQRVTVSGDTPLSFGGTQADGANPYFISDYPEIKQTDIKEDGPGGPLTITATFSEPLTQASQRTFAEEFVIQANGRPFLTARDITDPELKTVSSWNAAGDVFTLTYAGPYLPSGESSNVIALGLRQERSKDIDPDTGELLWEPLRMTDASGKPLAMNRADYLFKRPQLDLISFSQLTDKALGKTPAERRWRMTHEGPLRYTLAKDTSRPGLVSVSARTEQMVGGRLRDVLELRTNKAMRVVKDDENRQYTRLDSDEKKSLVVINLSKDAAGKSPVPLGSGYKVQAVHFSQSDPNLVFLDFPPGAFKDMEWIEVTLEKDFLDPAGNRPDAAKARAAGPVS